MGKVATLTLRCNSAVSGACPTTGSNVRSNFTTFNAADGRLSWTHRGTATGTQNASVTYSPGEQIDYITLDGATLNAEQGEGDVSER